MAINKVTTRARRSKHIKKLYARAKRDVRIVVFRSNKHIYAQLIDDANHKTLASASDVKIKSGKKVAKAEQVGTSIAELAIKLGKDKIFFDRNGYKYHGRVKALAEGARAGGLNF